MRRRAKDDLVELLVISPEDAERFPWEVSNVNLARKGLVTKHITSLIKMLERSPDVRTLDLSGNPFIGGTGVTSLVAAIKDARLSTIEAIHISKSGLTADTMKDVTIALPSLKTLDVSGNSIGDDGIRNLLTGQQLPNMTELYIKDAGLTDAGIHHITGVMQSISNLRVLDISGNGLKDEGIRSLADLLEHHSSLKELRLDGLPFTVHVSRYLGRALVRNPMVLSGGTLSISDAGDKAICSLLSEFVQCRGAKLNCKPSSIVFKATDWKQVQVSYVSSVLAAKAGLLCSGSCRARAHNVNETRDESVQNLFDGRLATKWVDLESDLGWNG
ncbi:hypothetical protein Agub_g9419, partial [Astrephomene gubernaculifera]